MSQTFDLQFCPDLFLQFFDGVIIFRTLPKTKLIWIKNVILFIKTKQSSVYLSFFKKKLLNVLSKLIGR